MKFSFMIAGPFAFEESDGPDTFTHVPRFFLAAVF